MSSNTIVCAVYRGYDTHGRFVKNIKLGKSLQEIAATLTAEGVSYTYLQEDTADQSLATLISAINPFEQYNLRRSRLAYYRLLQNHLQKKLTFDQATASFLKTCKHQTLQAQLRLFLHTRLSHGFAISEVLGRLSCFPTWHVAMIRSAEESGASLLPAIDRIVKLEELHHHNDLADLPNRLSNGFMYLLLAGLCMYVATSFVPSMRASSQDIGIPDGNPDPAIALIAAVGSFFVSPLGVLAAIVLVGLIVAAYRRALKNERFASAAEKVAWLMPGAKGAALDVDRHVALHMLAGFTATKTESARAIELTIPTMQSPYFRSVLRGQQQRIEDNEVTLAQSFRDVPDWGDDVISVLANAGDGGINTLLSSLADDYGKQAEAAIKIRSMLKNYAHLGAITAATGIISIAIYASIAAFNIRAGQQVYAPGVTTTTVTSPSP